MKALQAKTIVQNLKRTYLDNESVSNKEQLGYAGGIFGNAMGQDSTDTFSDKFNRNFMGLSNGMLTLKGNISTILGFFIPPLAGTLYDMPSASGKRSHLRTALLYAPVPFAVTSMLLFIVPTGNHIYNFIWTLFFSIFFSVADTFYDIALNTLALKMVSNPPDRKKFFTFETIAATLGSMLPGGIIPVFVGMTDDATKQKWIYFFIALGFCIIGIAAMYAPYMTIEERASFYTPGMTDKKNEKIKFDRHNITAILHNRPFVVMQLSTVFDCIRQITYKMLPYLYDDALDAYEMQTIVGTFSGAFSYVGLMAVPFVGKKISAKAMLVSGYSYTAFFYAVMSLFNINFSVKSIRRKKWIIGACIALAGIPNAAQGAARKIIVADSTDYMEWYSEKHYGIPIRSDGILSASQNIIGKFNALLKTNLYNAMFGLIKYKSNDLKSAAKPVQSDFTLHGIYLVSTLCGVLGNALPALAFLLDNYSGKRKETIYEELLEMRKIRNETTGEFNENET